MFYPLQTFFMWTSKKTDGQTNQTLSKNGASPTFSERSWRFKWSNTPGKSWSTRFSGKFPWGNQYGPTVNPPKSWYTVFLGCVFIYSWGKSSSQGGWMPLDSQIPMNMGELFLIYTLPTTNLALKNGGWKTSFFGQGLFSRAMVVPGRVSINKFLRRVFLWVSSRDLFQIDNRKNNRLQKTTNQCFNHFSSIPGV